MIDLHCHVLPGIDDGPRTIAGSIALGRAAAAAGTATIVATPHVNRRYRNDAATIAALAEETNAAFEEAGIELEILAGAEVSASRIADLPAEELASLTLGGGRWLLIESPFSPAAASLNVPLMYLREQGYEVLLAHPERCPTFQRDPRLLASLVDAGVRTSLTAGALVGQFGEHVRRFALRLVRDELVHNVASDAHDDVQRPPTIGPQLEQAGLTPLAGWLTGAVPSAILAGRELEPRPPVALAAPPRSLRLRRSRR